MRDYYEVEAESQEEAEAIVRNATDIEDVGEWKKHDNDLMFDCMSETGKVEMYNEYGLEVK